MLMGVLEAAEHKTSFEIWQWKLCSRSTVATCKEEIVGSNHVPRYHLSAFIKWFTSKNWILTFVMIYHLNN